MGLIALPVALAPLVYIEGRLEYRLMPRAQADGSRRAMTARWLALAVMLVTWIAFVLAARDFGNNGTQTFIIGMVTMRLDGLSLLLSALALTLGSLVIIYSGQYMAGEEGEEKFYALLVTLIGSMIGLACAADLFNLWVWFETMAISSYFLVAFYREQPTSLEAGFKYLVQSATGSGMVLLGIALVLATTGSLSLLGHTAISAGAALAAGALFTIGFGVKIALVPMHTWLPDAHSQAPSGISAMLSGVVIETGLLALLRALGMLSGVGLSWGVLLMVFGAVNMLMGNLMALRQTQVKRLLAYSSLSHIGYILVGLGVGIYALEVTGAQGGFFHVLNHGLMKGLAFLAAGALLYALHTASGDHSPLTVDDLDGAASRYPLVALTLSIAVLGLGGLPPLAGFMSKWQIFVAGFDTGNPWIAALVIFAALNSVLSLGYYAPLVNAMYRHKPSEAVLKGKTLSPSLVAPLIVLALAVVVFGVWPTLLQGLTEPAGSALLAAFGR
jgi:proton-translocating NADH-quinone oxidoreductase chain N